MTNKKKNAAANVVKIPVNVAPKNDDTVSETLEKEAVENDKTASNEINTNLPAEVKDEKDEKIEELTETVKRLYADFDNFRRKKEEEVSESRKRAVERVVLELLPIMDNFERAISASEISENYMALKDGLQMVYKQIYNLLIKEGVTEIESEGKLFNPEEHQAMQCEAAADYEDDTIIKELLKGYKLFDRVIRPSMVVVAKNKPQE